MEFLLHNPKTNSYKLYHSLPRLCRENGLNPDMISKDQLPVATPAGLIIGLVPNIKI